MDHLETAEGIPKGTPSAGPELGDRMAAALDTLASEPSPDARCILFLQAASDLLRSACGEDSLRVGLSSVTEAQGDDIGGASPGGDDAGGRGEWIAWRKGLLVGFLGSLALLVPFAAAMMALQVVILNPALP